MALGGGVVGDLCGFAAAIYLRGISFFQVPTTLLAQIDSSVGGKTGVNVPWGKNMVGAFHQPTAVMIDTKTLSTLPARELVAGWCESVKQGAVGGNTLFKNTVNFLTQIRNDPNSLLTAPLERLITAQCAFKASIVAGDERESTSRTDHRSRRVLNFGHTIAHALESVTNYRRYRHGEAVGLGMLVAAELSRALGTFSEAELKSLREAVRLCGPLPTALDLDENTIIEALARDKKSVLGSVQWVLLERIGRARIVDGKQISKPMLRASIRAGFQNARRK